MCYVCEAAGDGGIWYLNPRNYARPMYKMRKPGEELKGFGADPEMDSGRRILEILMTRFADRPEFDRRIRDLNANKGAGLIQIGQAVPLRDALRVVELGYPIAGVACACRKAIRGKEETAPQEYTCTALGVGMLKWERWPERYRGGVHFMSVGEASEWLVGLDKRGFMHSIMTFGGTYVGGLCNCDYPDCLAIRNRLDYGFEEVLLKGHYVAKIDYDKCNGCGICVQRCQFGAVKFEVTLSKTNVDMFRCFGCGLCQTGCPQSAIHLIERAAIPSLREVW